MTTKTEPRAHATVWREKTAGKITLYLSGGGVTSHIELTVEAALVLGEELVHLATEPGPRVGSPADLGIESLG